MIRLRNFVPVLIFGLAACASHAPVPDLGEIYNRSAQDHQDLRNPVVLIPGLMGSRLVDGADDRVVWGSFGDGYADPETPEGARRVSVPMREGVAVRGLVDSVRADGSLKELRVKVLGLPFVVDAYSDILGVLGVGGYRSKELAERNEVDYGADHFTCFQFDYDWRLSNAHNASRLHDFLLQTRVFVQKEIERRYGIVDYDVHFDLVAHSMGALIARYYLRYGNQPLVESTGPPTPDWSGARLVDRAILVAPPNGGAPQVAVDLIEGRDFGFLLPEYSAALLGTMPSLYELLPRPRHGQMRDSEGHRIEDIYDVDRWERGGWGLLDPHEDKMLAWLLPNESSPARRREIAYDHLAKMLRNARLFAAAMDVPSDPPSHLQIDLIAGDAFDTVDQVELRTNGTRVLSHAPGDGTVLRSSALLDERVGQRWQPTLLSPIHYRQVTFLFSNHLDLTKDPAFMDNMLYMLLESPRAHDARRPVGAPQSPGDDSKSAHW